LDRPAISFPSRAHVEKILGKNGVILGGIRELFATSAIAGYEEPLARLDTQLAEYARFVREAVLPHAREDFRKPEELYALALQEVGIDMPPRELAAKARQAFADVVREMQELAPRVAREKGIAATDYRDVIRALKKDQLQGAALLDMYRRRLVEIDVILARE